MAFHPILRLRRHMRAVWAYNEAWDCWQRGDVQGYLFWAVGDAVRGQPLEDLR